MNVLSLLKNDHDVVKDLFAEFERAASDDYDRKWELFDNIRRELMVHAKAEEEVFYPAIKAFDGVGRKLVINAINQHHEIENTILQIVRLDPADEKFEPRISALMEDVDNHIAEEEGQIFQFAKENCPEEELEDMGVQIEQRKSAIERRLAA